MHSPEPIAVRFDEYSFWVEAAAAIEPQLFGGTGSRRSKFQSKC